MDKSNGKVQVTYKFPTFQKVFELGFSLNPKPYPRNGYFYEKVFQHPTNDIFSKTLNQQLSNFEKNFYKKTQNQRLLTKIKYPPNTRSYSAWVFSFVVNFLPCEGLPLKSPKKMLGKRRRRRRRSNNGGHPYKLLHGFVGLAYQGKDIVFRLIIEYSSLRDFCP
jgi:hypothetical protein